MVVREMVLCGADGTQTFTRGCIYLGLGLVRNYKSLNTIKDISRRIAIIVYYIEPTFT